jgi:hypothetical protein
LNSRCFGLFYRAILPSLAVLSFLLPPVIVSGQLSRGGAPATTLLRGMQLTVPVVTLAAPDMSTITAQDHADPLQYRFAVNISCGKDLSASGSWHTLPDGGRICIMEIRAPGAKALSVLFDRFYIPDGGRLFIFSQDRMQVLGAYTSLNNSSSGLFAVQLIHGDRLTLEYEEPPSLAILPELRISSVAYAYRGVPDPGAPDGFGGAGPCEVNINCPEGQNFQDEKKGVVRIQAYKNGSSYWCSGSLINNTRMDATPYVLSADHCYKGGTPDDLLQWIFYFSYDGPGCENPPVPPQERALTGATLKARGGDVTVSGSDFLLVLLSDPIPDTFDVFLNGWNRINTPPRNGVGIHHPQGDIKKISTFTQKATTTSWIGGNTYTHWLVTWAGTANGHGVTEGGSSGSALFDSAGMIVGALTGGGSSCDSSNLSEPDYYGKFSYSWISCGPDSASRLQPWLDPDNTGVQVLAGKPLSVATLNAAGTFAVYPNPTHGTFTVELETSATGSSFTYTICDTRGMVLSCGKTSFPGIRADFDISTLVPGIYFLKLSGETRTMVGKIIKF